jgi:hypothetical protein
VLRYGLPATYQLGEGGSTTEAQPPLPPLLLLLPVTGAAAIFRSLP